MGLKKAFGKECVATQSRTIPPDEVATLRVEITKDVLAKVALMLQKMGAPTVDLANLIVEDQQSQKSTKGSRREIGSSSKVSTESKSMAITPILTDSELKDLSQDCKWLHTCVSRMREEDPFVLTLQKEQFCFVESRFVIIGPVTLGNFG